MRFIKDRRSQRAPVSRKYQCNFCDWVDPVAKTNFVAKMADALVGICQQRRRRQRKRPIRRLFNVRLTSASVRDLDFVSRYRVDRILFEQLLEAVGQTLAKGSRGGHSITPDTQVLVSLRCLAKGAFFSEVADTHGISRSSVCRIVHGFVDAVIDNVDNISFPVERGQQTELKKEFFNKCHLPNIVGAIDGTLVPILAPTTDEGTFICRKGYHAINCQAVATAHLRFIDVVARWPGSSHDAGVFENSTLKDYVETDRDTVLLGDSGYPLRRYLITPILHPANEAEERYNRRHKRGREVVERAFGVLKSRFRCLHISGGVLPFSPGKSCRAFLACCKLHNLCMDHRMPLPDAMIDDREDQGGQINREATRPGLTARAHYVGLP